jgi:hypothetical protein
VARAVIDPGAMPPERMQVALADTLTALVSVDAKALLAKLPSDRRLNPEQRAELTAELNAVLKCASGQFGGDKELAQMQAIVKDLRVQLDDTFLKNLPPQPRPGEQVGARTSAAGRTP